jgi:hypothetical protein
VASLIGPAKAQNVRHGAQAHVAPACLQHRNIRRVCIHMTKNWR